MHVTELVRSKHLLCWLVIAGLAVAPSAAYSQAPPRTFIRVNQLGYLPGAPKVAVACSLDSVSIKSFTVQDLTGRVVLGPRAAKNSGRFGPCASTHRLDFSSLRSRGRYQIVAGGAASPSVRIDATHTPAPPTHCLYYMRQQRSGFNPIVRDSVHKRDGIIVDHPTRTGQFINVSGGWADASDYLQYVTTSANATFVMLMAYRDNPRAFADKFASNGLPGPNGIADILDEARHGLDWLLRMYPGGEDMFNQLGDDRDHRYWDLPWTDSSDYGWGRGKERPVYPCTGKPQGVVKAKNRSTGYASTAGKYTAAFALGAVVFRKRDPAFAERLRATSTRCLSIRETSRRSLSDCSRRITVLLRGRRLARRHGARRCALSLTLQESRISSGTLWCTPARSRLRRGWARIPHDTTNGIRGTTTDTTRAGEMDLQASARSWRGFIGAV